jgi:hypothetical protein
MIKQQNNVFIDPENCGSSIGYYLTIDEYTPKDKPAKYSVNATVVLADCSHKIDWIFTEGKDSAVDKIDAAIAMMQEFRRKYLEAKKMVMKLNK